MLEDEGKTRTDRMRVFAVEPGMGLELKLIHDSSEPWRAIEVWTSRSIYWLDGDRTCVAVMSRDTGGFEPGHRFLGGRLTGGEQRGTQGMSISQPYPLPGMKAVFQLSGGFAMTSTVEKVVVRVKIDNVDTGGEPDWNRLPELVRTLPPK